MKTYVAAETVDDCEKILGLSSNGKYPELVVITVSLEAMYFLQKYPSVTTLYAWEIFDMESLIDKAFYDSEIAYQEWTSLFKNDKYGAYDIAAQGRLHIEFLQHAFAAFYLTKEIIALCKKQNAALLFLNKKARFYSRYIEESGEYIRKNTLLSEILYEMAQQEKVSCFGGSVSKRPNVHLLFLAYVGREILHAFYDGLRGKPTLEKLFGAVRNKDVVISGWGKDLSRVLSIEKLAEEFSNNGTFSVANIVWRRGKLKEIPRSAANIDTFFVRETFYRKSTYGLAFSLFPLAFRIKKLFFYGQVVAPRLDRARRELSGVLAELLQLKSFIRHFSYNAAFCYLEANICEYFSNLIFDRFSPRVFIGSDADSPSSRMELLIAKERKIVTFSTPHGYQAYATPRYNFIADYQLTHGKAFQEKIALSGVAPDNIFAVGTNLFKPRANTIFDLRKARITIGVRSWGGLWSNFESRQDNYHKALINLIRGIKSKFPNVSITIKSHPNGDYFDYYDGVAKQEGVTHVKKGWRSDEFRENTDILACIGALPSLYVDAIYAAIPVILITNPMSKTQRKLGYLDQKSTLTVKDENDAIVKISDLLASQEAYWRVSQTQTELGMRDYGSDSPEKNIVKLLMNKMTK